MNYENESSEEKQKRIGCNIWRGVNNWNCYIDCAFYNGKSCTYNEEDY